MCFLHNEFQSGYPPGAFGTQWPFSNPPSFHCPLFFVSRWTEGEKVVWTLQTWTRCGLCALSCLPQGPQAAPRLISTSRDQKQFLALCLYFSEARPLDCLLRRRVLFPMSNPFPYPLQQPSTSPSARFSQSTISGSKMDGGRRDTRKRPTPVAESVIPNPGHRLRPAAVAAQVSG